MSDSIREVDALIVGASLSGAAAAKRLVDAGYETVVMEMKRLPRRKICSGILSPRGHRFLLENFGPIPKQALHEPTSCRGVTFHFPSRLSVPMDFFGGPTAHLHRMYSDYWAIRQSGAEVHEGVCFTGLKDLGDYVEVTAREGSRPLKYRTKILIGADGPVSNVLRKLYRDYPKSIQWFVVGQKFHDIIECPLDEDYFHFWFHPKLGHYTWSHARDERQIVGVGYEKAGYNYNERHQRVVNYLEKNHGVRLRPTEDRETLVENFGPSLLNRYVFGKGRVLITGQAAGFLNMMAEGMSCALHSGAIAGEAAVEHFRFGQSASGVYREMIQSEVRRCTDQWNPFLIAFGKPHEADFPAALMKHSPSERRKILREMLSFIRIYSQFNWGRVILRESVLRLLRGYYGGGRWI